MWTNESDWTGNYLGAGVGSVQFWVDNRSGIGSDIPLRIALNGPGGWFASDAKITSDTVSGNEWGVLSFDLNPTEFTWIAGGTNDFNATLSDVNILEVLAAQNTPTLGGGGVLRGDLIASDLRFDSFSVGASVPEPTSVSLACLSALGIAFRRKRNS
ncbi:MAG: PEP-CTERM sorting domain-containing protein [Planctomycetota bacterium]